MKIATWNVNSIRARWERLAPWLERQRPDVVCLQETKVTDGDFPFVELKGLGYHAAHLGQKTYNGVALLAREELTDVRRGMEDGADDPQARLIGATVSGVRVLSAYVPNGQAVGSEKFAYKLAWLERLRRHLEERYRPEQPLIIAGDFNIAPEPIDVHDPAAWEGQVLCTAVERAALARLVGFGLVDVYRELHPEPGRFTWWDYRRLAFPKNLGLRIDHLFATAPLARLAQRAEIDREARKGKLPSDHAPVLVELAAPPLAP